MSHDGKASQADNFLGNYYPGDDDIDQTMTAFRGALARMDASPAEAARIRNLANATDAQMAAEAASETMRAIQEARRLVEIPRRAAIGERILRWLHWSARPSITNTVQLPDLETTRQKQAAARQAGSRPAVVTFWQALDPAEREVLMAAAVPAGDRLIAGDATPSLLPLNGENCTILYSDVVGFSSPDRNDADRLVIRKALLDMTRLTLRGIPGTWSQDRGDGLLTVMPPSVPTADVIGLLHRVLPSALDRHNRTDRESTRFRLRIAVDVGPVTSDAIGVSGETIIIAARMLDAPIFKAAIAASTASLGVIASRFVYDTAIRHSLNRLDLAGYSQVLVEVKGLTILARMKLFTDPVPPVYFYRSAARGPTTVGAGSHLRRDRRTIECRRVRAKREAG